MQMPGFTLLIITLLLANYAQAISPCPPEIPVDNLNLSMDNPDWIVARVTVEEDPQSGSRSLLTPVLVRVDEVYAGVVVHERIRIRDTIWLQECGYEGLPRDAVGSSWLVGMPGPNADGTYGSPSDFSRNEFSRVPIVDDEVFGKVPGFVNGGDSRPLGEFAHFIRSQVPGVDSDEWQISISPRLPGPSDEVALHLTRKADNGNLDCAVSTNAVLMDGANGVIKVSFRRATSSTPCASFNPTRLPIGALAPPANTDTYLVEVFEEAMDDSAAPFDPDNLIASFDYPIRTDTPQLANAEVPAQDSVQSGIGIIRGWACEANRVTVQFDDLAPFELAYGTRRTDTREVCGDSNNGYGGVFAWGLLGAGQHTMRTYIDDSLVDTVSFEVAGLEQPFVTGLEGTYVLEGFPGPRESVTVRWSEAAQNFVIVETARTD